MAMPSNTNFIENVIQQVDCETGTKYSDVNFLLNISLNLYKDNNQTLFFNALTFARFLRRC